MRHVGTVLSEGEEGGDDAKALQDVQFQVRPDEWGCVRRGRW